jgi:hypothetical protein
VLPNVNWLAKASQRLNAAGCAALKTGGELPCERLLHAAKKTAFEAVNASAKNRFDFKITRMVSPRCCVSAVVAAQALE